MSGRGGFDIAVTEEAWAGNEDRRWLGSRMGADQNRSGTLDVSTFSAAHLAAKGAIPSGTLLGQIASTKKWGPYKKRTSAKVQTLTRSSTSGELTLSADGETTAELTGSAAAFTAANVTTALGNLSNISTDDFEAVQTSATVITITGDIPNLSVNDVDLAGGTVAAAVTSTGAEAVSNGLEIAAGFLFTTTKVGDGTGADLATAADVGVAIYWGPGIIIRDFLPSFEGTTDGELDDEAEADLANFLKFEDKA